ncbi:MAG: HAD family phosphatase [Tannerella sp.]|jgi:HAD superfamily hydrolase (TIGR01509 family)|nr:HAD family phosphatase [Tannerella sp.]
MKAALFDFDGVLVDTEPVYDLFWNEAALRYGIGIDHFAQVIKGTTLLDILERYFSTYSQAQKDKLLEESRVFESKMPFPPMPGSLEFLRLLKGEGVKTALVTSSDRNKIDRALRQLRLEDSFDVVITSDDVDKGKPDPACYLAAVREVGLPAVDCLVFEDSLNGIRSGLAAGLRVVALCTTLPAEELQGLAQVVIPDLQGKDYRAFLSFFQ